MVDRDNLAYGDLIYVKFKKDSNYNVHSEDGIYIVESVDAVLDKYPVGIHDLPINIAAIDRPFDYLGELDNHECCGFDEIVCKVEPSKLLIFIMSLRLDNNLNENFD